MQSNFCQAITADEYVESCYFSRGTIPRWNTRTTYLPKVHLNCAIQLDKASFQMHSLTLGVVQVDCTLLVLVLVNVSQMGTQLKQTTNTGNESQNRHREGTKAFSLPSCLKVNYRILSTWERGGGGGGERAVGMVGPRSLPGGVWVCLVPFLFWRVVYQGDILGVYARGYLVQSPLVLTSSGGRRSKLYASYWNDYLFRCNFLLTLSQSFLNSVFLSYVRQNWKAESIRSTHYDSTRSI